MNNCRGPDWSAWSAGYTKVPCRLFTWWHIYNIIRNVPTLCCVFGHMDVIDCFWYFVPSKPNLAASILDHFCNVIVKCGWRGYVCLSASEITLLSFIYCFRCGDDVFSVLCRFVWALVEDAEVVVKSRISALYAHPRGHLFSQLSDLLYFCEGYEINDQTGTKLRWWSSSCS